MNFTTNIPAESGGVATTLPFPSSSTPGLIYECRIYNNGTTSCNCPKWTRRPGPDGKRSCRHTEDPKTKRFIAALLGELPPPKPANTPQGSPTSLPTPGKRRFDLSI